MATFVTHDGVELAYEDRGGDAFPLVMLHGWGQTQAMFRHQLSDLAPDRRIVTLDLRGHGRSAKPHFGYRIARFSRDVYELLDHLGLERFDALGWSMGVSIWWSFIDQYRTDRIRRLLLGCDGSPVAPSSQASIAEQVPDANLHVFGTTPPAPTSRVDERGRRRWGARSVVDPRSGGPARARASLALPRSRSSGDVADRRGPDLPVAGEGVGLLVVGFKGRDRDRPQIVGGPDVVKRDVAMGIVGRVDDRAARAGHLKALGACDTHAVRGTVGWVARGLRQ
jgi:pimeloyl-ACP methyl ester carboxylesterase